MNTMPVLSVVMSVFNAEKYLHKAVDSVLNQTFQDFEFIIIEDCSTDRSLEILEEYARKDSRIVLIKKDKNKGAAGFIENLNIGLDKSRGKYIARMDADDISLPERFEKQIAVLEGDAELFIVGANLEMMDENDNHISIKSAPVSDSEIKNTMYKSIALYHPVLMFRNDGKIRYREKMLSCEDYDLYFRLMLQNKKMANIPEILLKYRVLDSSISRKDKTFIRWMMVEKARAFYLESKNSGKDSYDDFKPENIQKITDSDYKSSLEDLVFAVKTALKFSEKEELNSILKKIKKFYPNQSVLKYKIASALPNPSSKLYSKLLIS
ncbi:MAG: glycosyltransferase [Bergeyella sp.]